MSLPNIPDINPEINLDREDAITLLLTSIAMEEISLSHILNAEGEKIQHVLKKHPCVEELLKVNRSVERILRSIVKKEILLQFKMEDILDLIFEAEKKVDHDIPDKDDYDHMTGE